MAKTPIKALLEGGLAALCTHIKKCSDTIVKMGEETGAGLAEANEIFLEKQDIFPAVSFTIPVKGWGTDASSPGYFYCDISIPGLLATDIVDVTVLPESYSAASAAGFIPTESMKDKLRLRAAKIPTAEIKAQYHITSTVAYTAEGGT